MTLIHSLMRQKRKHSFWYPCPLYPIRTESSIKRRSLFDIETLRVCGFKSVTNAKRMWTLQAGAIQSCQFIHKTPFYIIIENWIWAHKCGVHHWYKCDLCHVCRVLLSRRGSRSVRGDLSEVFSSAAFLSVSLHKSKPKSTNMLGPIRTDPSSPSPSLSPPLPPLPWDELSGFVE